MKSTVEQHNVPHRRKVTVKDVRLVPVIGRHCQSSLKRLEHAYRDCRPAAVLVSRSRFAPGYVVDSFLATIDKEETVILIAQALDDPTAFMDEVVRGIGFECKDLNLSNLEDIAGLFLRYQKVHQRRTVLVVRDIDAHGAEVRAAIRKLIEKEVANEFGLMVILTGPTNDSAEPQDPMLDAVLERIVGLVETMRSNAEAQGITLHMERLLRRDEEWLAAAERVFDEARQAAREAGVELTLPGMAPRNTRKCEFVEGNGAFVSWDGDIHPCYFLWHRYACYVGGVTKRVKPWVLGNVRDRDLRAIWNNGASRSFRERVLGYKFPFCFDCGFALCDYVSEEEFEQDCYIEPVPCGACLWCTGLFHCLQ